MVLALNGQHAGKSQLVHLLCKERNGFKAGLGFGGAARKGSVVAQAVVIHQIAEWKAVAEQDSLARRAVHGGLVRAIQRGELFDVSCSVGGVDALVVGIKLLQGIGNRADQRFGVLQRQPDVLVLFLPMVMAVALHVLAEIPTGHVSREEGWPRLFRINDGVKALVAHPDVEMLGRS